MRSVDDDVYEVVRDDISDGEGDELVEVDLVDYVLVDGVLGVRVEIDIDGGISDVLGGRDGKFEVGGKDDSDGRVKFYGEIMGW